MVVVHPRTHHGTKRGMPRATAQVKNVMQCNKNIPQVRDFLDQ
jgi:hypothetical protein